MSEELIIQHCSPTLAGMKTGNMFSCDFCDEQEMRASIRALNRRLVKKGLRTLPLRYENNRALIYIFRPSKLSLDLGHSTANRLLCERGYKTESPDRCVIHLKKRLLECEEFPHEIGLFLGYPPEDVRGFIENRAGGCKLCGTWKVYGDADAARRTFAKFKKCTDTYIALLRKGQSIERLSVIG